MEIAAACGCDVEEIRDRVGRGGPIGHARSVFEAATRFDTLQQPGERDPADYPLVIVARRSGSGTGRAGYARGRDATTPLQELLRSTVPRAPDCVRRPMMLISFAPWALKPDERELSPRAAEALQCNRPAPGRTTWLTRTIRARPRPERAASRLQRRTPMPV